MKKLLILFQRQPFCLAHAHPNTITLPLQRGPSLTVLHLYSYLVSGYVLCFPFTWSYHCNHLCFVIIPDCRPTNLSLLKRQIELMPKAPTRRSLRLIGQREGNFENVSIPITPMTESSITTYHRPISGASAQYNDCGVLPSEWYRINASVTDNVPWGYICGYPINRGMNRVQLQFVIDTFSDCPIFHVFIGDLYGFSLQSIM